MNLLLYCPTPQFHPHIAAVDPSVSNSDKRKDVVTGISALSQLFWRSFSAPEWTVNNCLHTVERREGWCHLASARCKPAEWISFPTYMMRPERWSTGLFSLPYIKAWERFLNSFQALLEEVIIICSNFSHCEKGRFKCSYYLGVLIQLSKNVGYSTCKILLLNSQIKIVIFRLNETSKLLILEHESLHEQLSSNLMWKQTSTVVNIVKKGDFSSQLTFCPSIDVTKILLKLLFEPLAVWAKSWEGNDGL